MSVLIDCVLIALAASHLVDLWFNGSLLAPQRAYVQATRSANDRWWLELLSCWYCLSHWAVGGLALLYWGAAACGWVPGRVVQFLVAILACIRVVTLTNLLLPRYARFERGTDPGAQSSDHRL